MLGSHNSGTGEASHWSCLWLFPFTRCQSKTIIEQYECGVRYFDIRLIWDGGKWKFAHGLWRSKVDAENVLKELRLKALEDGEKIYMRIWYERETTKDNVEMLMLYANELDSQYPIFVDNICTKKPWKRLKEYMKMSIKDCYHILNLTKNKKALLPIPWIWWLLRTKDMKTMDEGKVNLCDFV